MSSILVIDDDAQICELLARHLGREGHTVTTMSTGKKALLHLRTSVHDLVICDYRLPDITGKEFLQEAKLLDPALKVIIITGYADTRIAVDVIKSGARDFMVKPIDIAELSGMISQLMSEKTGPVQDPRVFSEPEEKVSPAYKPELDTYVQGTSPEAKKLLSQIELVAPTNYSVIIYGESGTGKEAVAHKIHQKSRRRQKPFVAVDCGTLTKELAGSELFGHEKGSFTGAVQSKMGQFELAEGGTIFLDEIANLIYEIQVSLLRVI